MNNLSLRPGCRFTNIYVSFCVSLRLRKTYVILKCVLLNFRKFCVNARANFFRNSEFMVNCPLREIYLSIFPYSFVDFWLLSVYFYQY